MFGLLVIFGQFWGEPWGLDHGTGHLASMSPPENQRLDTDKG